MTEEEYIEITLDAENIIKKATRVLGYAVYENLEDFLKTIFKRDKKTILNISLFGCDCYIDGATECGMMEYNEQMLKVRKRIKEILK